MANTPKTIVDVASAVKDYTDKNYTSRQLLKDTVGWVGGNFFKIDFEKTLARGMDVVENADGSLTFSGTKNTPNSTSYIKIGVITDVWSLRGKTLKWSGVPTGSVISTTYHINVEVSNGSTETIFRADDTHNPLEFTMPNDAVSAKVMLNTVTNNTVTAKTFYPMCSRADQPIESFAKYHESVERCKWDKSSQKVAGAYNLLNNTAVSTAISPVTWTVNADKTVTATVSGALSSAILLFVRGTNTNDFVPIDTGGVDLKLLGSPVASGVGIYAFYKTSESGAATQLEDVGNGVIIPAAAKYINVYCRFGIAAQQGTYTFKPMITPDLTAIYDDYVPHAMTNKELTEDAAVEIPVTFDTGWTNLESRTRVLKTGNRITAIISVFTDHSVGVGDVDTMFMIDQKYAPSKSVFVPVVTYSGFGLVYVSASAYVYYYALNAQSAIDSAGGVLGEAVWIIGK